MDMSEMEAARQRMDERVRGCMADPEAGQHQQNWVHAPAASGESPPSKQTLAGLSVGSARAISPTVRQFGPRRRILDVNDNITWGQAETSREQPFPA